MTLTIGELFAGYGGLGLAVSQAFDATPAWFCEWEDAPSRILAHHWPQVPNYRDVTAVDWANVVPVDIISGGFPCQDVSLAGRRAGMTEGTRSNLWGAMRTAIETIQPRYVVAENVRGLLSAKASSASDVEPGPGSVGDDGPPNLRAIARVLGDLSDLGYDAQWRGLRAADVGAPHQRFRVFILAERRDAADAHDLGLGQPWPGGPASERHPATGRGSATQDPDQSTGGERGIPAPGQAQGRGARADSGRRGGAPDTPTIVRPVADAQGLRWDEGWPEPAGVLGGPDAAECSAPVDWGPYTPAIDRWESVLGAPAPAPTEITTKGKHRLSAAFAEWMMGLPAGWVTQVPGVTRNDQLKAIGNGVVPQQARAALTDMLLAIHAQTEAAA